MLHGTAKNSTRIKRHRWEVALLVFVVALVFGVAERGAAAGGDKPKEGDILRIFDKGRVYVVTNDDAQLADELLLDTNVKERRVLTPEEWKQMPAGVRRYVSVVFLVNRQYLPPDVRLPEKCLAERDELWIDSSRFGSDSGVTYEVTLSAPDGAWLRQAIREFRKMSDAPRRGNKRNVRSRAIIPIGAGAVRAADPLLAAGEEATVRGHIVNARNYPRVTDRIAEMDEVFLIDRSALNDPSFARIPGTDGNAVQCGPHDTLWWKERKPNGRYRIYISAPLADHLAETVRRNPDPMEAPDTPTVVYTARDLRAVRRVAVATVKQGIENPEIARRLASKAATDLRALDAFEVLERAGLSEVLGEVALDQAGITKAADRTRVRQLAAADALLIIELTGIAPRTEYAARHRRLTGRMGGPPPRPLEPSRLKIPIVIPGKENDPVARVLADAVLGRAVGSKSDREYKEALNYYNNETLPRWHQRVEEYEYEKRNRVVSWEESLTVKSSVIVSGSLRLVDLSDGLVLWETVFVADGHGNYPGTTRTITTRGEDSVPGKQNVPAPQGAAPENLVIQAIDNAVGTGIQILRGTTILPTNAVLSASANGEASKTASLSGRILDIDGDTVLIGLGATDGLKLNDTLTVALPDGVVVSLVVTKVRPRTCDAAFAPSATAIQRAKVSVGMNAAKETTP